MTDPPTPPPLPASPAALAIGSLADFSDRLPPMLVKELRQGLRTRAFLAVFLTVQIGLAVVMLLSIAYAGSPADAGRGISGIVFLFYGLALLVIQPLRGIGALHGEIKAHTIELMELTRLSAWKIVLGKWVSLLAQSGLILVSVLPYLVIRYWLGGMNLFGELALMLFLFLGSAGLIACVIGLSPMANIILRGLVPLAGGAAMLMFVFIIPFESSSFNSATAWASGQNHDLPSLFFSLFAICYLTWIALGTAVSVIAPRAENHASLKRVGTLGLLLLCFPLALFFSSQPTGFWSALICVIAVPVILTSLTESVDVGLPQSSRFTRRGPLFGRLTALFLHPGWPFAAIFTLLCGILAGTLLMVSGNDRQNFLIPICVFGSLFLPAALIAPFDKRLSNRVAAYLISLLAVLICVFLYSILQWTIHAPDIDFDSYFPWMPISVALMLMEFDGLQVDPDVLAVQAAWVLFYFLILAVFGLIPALRKLGGLNQELAAHAAPPVVPEEPDPPAA